MMAGILARVGFPFLAGDGMASMVFTGDVYTWKENLILAAGWKTYRLTLFEDGILVWDEPHTDRIKGSVQLAHVFRRIGVGTLYNGVEQRKAAAKCDLNLLDYGLLLPFSRGDGGLELSQFAVTSVNDLRCWMQAFARQMNVIHILDMIADSKMQGTTESGKPDSMVSESYWMEEPRRAMIPDGHHGGHLDNFKASECADIWREFQETYHVCMSGAEPNMQRSWFS